jgi:hypothetical protein
MFFNQCNSSSKDDNMTTTTTRRTGSGIRDTKSGSSLEREKPDVDDFSDKIDNDIPFGYYCDDVDNDANDDNDEFSIQNKPTLHHVVKCGTLVVNLIRYINILSHLNQITTHRLNCACNYISSRFGNYPTTTLHLSTGVGFKEGKPNGQIYALMYLTNYIHKCASIEKFDCLRLLAKEYLSRGFISSLLFEEPTNEFFAELNLKIPYLPNNKTTNSPFVTHGRINENMLHEDLFNVLANLWVMMPENIASIEKLSILKEVDYGNAPEKNSDKLLLANNENDGSGCECECDDVNLVQNASSAAATTNKISSTIVWGTKIPKQSYLQLSTFQIEDILNEIVANPIVFLENNKLGSCLMFVGFLENFISKDCNRAGIKLFNRIKCKFGQEMNKLVALFHSLMNQMLTKHKRFINNGVTSTNGFTRIIHFAYYHSSNIVANAFVHAFYISLGSVLGLTTSWLLDNGENMFIKILNEYVYYKK